MSPRRERNAVYRSLLGPAACCFLMLASSAVQACSSPVGSDACSRFHSGVTPFPQIRIRSLEAREPIQLKRVDIRADITGRSAQTEVELELRNPNQRVLEGELQFPLRPGQTVVGFALDIDNRWRSAVPVPKAKGQQVFEDVIRARVDPALLEVTEGNNYKLRVYPLPPGGSRRVRLTLSESLPVSNTQGVQYALPLAFADKVETMDVQVRLAGLGAYASKIQATLGSQALQARAEGQAALVAWQGTGVSSPGTLSVQQPRVTPGHLIATEQREQKSYFYAEVQVPDLAAPRPEPRQLALLWDASGSGADRDHGREFALLDEYFKSLGKVSVDLVIGRDRAEPAQRFEVVGGQWRDLRSKLEAISYDGATNLSSFAVPKGADMALLFTDGLGNFGTNEWAASPVPLYTVQAATQAHALRLRSHAERSGGEHLDLQNLRTDEAVQRLRTVRSRLVALRSNEAKDLVSGSVYPQGGRLQIAGQLTSSQATVVLELQTPQGPSITEDITITPEMKPGHLAANRWAQLLIDDLGRDAERNQAAIRRVSQAFGLPSIETSLIVLEAVADYVRYEITPPSELRGDYEQLKAQMGAQQAASRGQHLESVVRRFNAEVEWWKREFPKEGRAQPPVARLNESVTPFNAKSPFETRALRSPATAAAPSPMVRLPAQMAPASVADRLDSRSDSSANSSSNSSAIQLQKWTPDAAYARRLRAAKTDKLYAIYLDEKPNYRNSTAFFLDVSDLLLERGQTELGLRVLSNLAEMNLENRHILRILGYRLLQAKQYALAISVLEKVRTLSPEEPQSWRDLGLAYAQDGRPQEAIDALWEVVSRRWDGRFPDIELIALNELNALASRAKVAGQRVDVSAIDSRLLRNLPLDLRAALTWDADNTDIDLHVTDPDGETAFFGRPLTWQGARVSRDFTRGYGPEVFSLRNAKPGVYTVRAQFYGHTQQIVAPATTLMLQLSTGFGTEQQVDQSVTLRLNGRGDMVTVGTFEVKAPAK